MAVAAAARGRLGFRGYLQGFACYLAMVDPDAGGECLQEVRQLLDGQAENQP